MDKAVFNNLKKLKFDGIPLTKFASWAIWDKTINGKNQDIPQIIEENVDKLKGNIVFVGLNFGNQKGDLKDWKDWQNFHSVKRLIGLLSGTRFEGAYLTDIIKNHYDSDSGKVMTLFKNDEKKRKVNIDFFFQEIAQLKAKNIEMYLFGEKVEYIFEKYVMRQKDFCSFRQKVSKCQRIYHYAGQVTDFLKKASVQIGKDKPKNSTEKDWIYEPLWDSAARCSTPAKK
jgi:hypothetical protein